jgi:phage shock protein PspC (stress-responsive transcriptional regulator)
MHGLIRRYIRTLPEYPLSKTLWLGVCADVSKTLDIPAGAVRFFVLLYTPLGLGLIFYFIYYWFIINRVSIPLLTPEHEIQITKIKSYYFGS